MFRMTTGAGPFGPGSAPASGFTAVGAVAAVAVAMATFSLLEVPAPRLRAPGEIEVAQRAAAVVAGAYRGEVSVDRRDRTILLSYVDRPIMSADRVAWAVCDTILSDAGIARPASAPSGWQVVTLPEAGSPGSSRLGGQR